MTGARVIALVLIFCIGTCEIVHQDGSGIFDKLSVNYTAYCSYNPLIGCRYFSTAENIRKEKSYKLLVKIREWVGKTTQLLQNFVIQNDELILCGLAAFVTATTVGIMLGIIGANMKTMLELRAVCEDTKILQVDMHELLAKFRKGVKPRVRVFRRRLLLADAATQTYPKGFRTIRQFNSSNGEAEA